MSKITNFTPIEPLKSNRFIIKFNDEVKVPEYMFRSFKMYNEGENLIFKSNKTNERLVCKVICDSYPVTNITREEWSKLEGWLPNYFDLNPDTLNKFQFKFEYLYSI